MFDSQYLLLIGALIPFVIGLVMFVFIILTLREMFKDTDHDNDNHDGGIKKKFYPKDGGFSDEILVKYK